MRLICPICNSEDIEQKDFDNHFGLTIVECNNCDCARGITQFQNNYYEGVENNENTKRISVNNYKILN